MLTSSPPRTVAGRGSVKVRRLVASCARLLSAHGEAAGVSLAKATLDLYAELAIDGEVLDLMASWVSHFRRPPEHLTVLGQGSLEVRSGNDVSTLQANETARYVVDVPHSISNPGNAVVHALMVVVHAS